MPGPLVSFLMPTRQRAQLAIRSITRLAERTADPGAVEVVLGVDNDDIASGETIIAACVLRNLGVSLRLCVFAPLGYANLHVYNNALARRATGAWLAIWNDDVLMETPEYDAVLRDQATFAVLDPEIRNAAPTFRSGLFPVVPRLWHTTLGHLSANPHCDTYMFLIADTLKIRQPGWSVYHDRFDESGQNDDATYRARAYQTTTFYNDPEVVARANWDARKLGRVLGRRPGTIMKVHLRADPRPRRAFPQYA